MQKINWVFLIILVFGANSFGQNVGIIFRLKGTAVLKDTNGKQSRMNQKNFIRVLKVGQQLKANNDSQIEIRFCGNKYKSIYGKNWFVVPNCPATKTKRFFTRYRHGRICFLAYRNYVVTTNKLFDLLKILQCFCFCPPFSFADFSSGLCPKSYFTSTPRDYESNC